MPPLSAPVSGSRSSPDWPGSHSRGRAAVTEQHGPERPAYDRSQHAPRVRYLDVAGQIRLLYDAFWLTAIDDFDSPRVAESGAGMAIGAAALAELAGTGHIVIRPVRGGADHQIWSPDRKRPGPDDSVGMSVVEAINAEPRPRPVRTWLEYLEVSGLADRVADHMVTHGLLRRVEVTGRRGLRRRSRTVYEPVESLVAGAACYRLRKWLDAPDQRIAWADVWLLGMCEATGLHHVFRYRSEAARRRSHQLQQAMPDPWRALLLHLADAIGTAATARGL